MPDADYDDFGSLHHVEGRNTQGGLKEDQKRTRGGIMGRTHHEKVGDEGGEMIARYLPSAWEMLAISEARVCLHRENSDATPMVHETMRCWEEMRISKDVFRLVLHGRSTLFKCFSMPKSTLFNKISRYKNTFFNRISKVFLKNNSIYKREITENVQTMKTNSKDCLSDILLSADAAAMVVVHFF